MRGKSVNSTCNCNTNLIESEYELESVTKLYLKQSRKILNELDPNQKKAYKEWKKQIID